MAETGRPHLPITSPAPGEREAAARPLRAIAEVSALMSGATVAPPKAVPGAPSEPTADAAASLADLLAAGERAAFHGPPAQAVGALEKAIAMAGQAGRRAEVTAAAWLLGVALAARGRYGGALTVLSPLLEPGEADGAAPEQQLFAALA